VIRRHNGRSAAAGCTVRIASGLLLLSLLGPTAARAEMELVRCGSDDWRMRLAAGLGPRLYLEHDRIQFAFGTDLWLRLVGPLALGVGVDAGVIEHTELVTALALRLHLLRSCKLELAAEARGGVWFAPGRDAVDPSGTFSLGLALAHDLGERFYVVGRLGGGMVVRSSRGGFMELSIDVGLRLF
jgi:hypothetical protein